MIHSESPMLDLIHQKPKVKKSANYQSVNTSESFQHFKKNMRAEGKLGFESSKELNLKDEEKLNDVLKF